MEAMIDQERKKMEKELKRQQDEGIYTPPPLMDTSYPPQSHGNSPLPLYPPIDSIYNPFTMPVTSTPAAAPPPPYLTPTPAIAPPIPWPPPSHGEATHHVVTGTLALSPIGETEEQHQLKEVQSQVDALTGVLETQLRISQALCDATFKADTQQSVSNLRDTAEPPMTPTFNQEKIRKMLINREERPKQQLTPQLPGTDLHKDHAVNKLHRNRVQSYASSSSKNPFIAGSFTGVVDTSNVTDVPISGVLDPLPNSATTHQLANNTPTSGAGRHSDDSDDSGAHAYVAPLRMAPGQQSVYQPFQLKDIEGLMLKLPRLTNGGLAWLRALFKNTAGETLCWGDLQAVLVRAADEQAAKNIRTELERRMHVLIRTNTPLHVVKLQLTEIMRTRYPTHLTDALLSLQMKDGEDYFTYKQRAKALFHDATGEALTPGTGNTLVFYSTLIKGLPEPVQESLADVVGLHSKTEEEIDAHCNHHVSKLLKTRKQSNEQKQQMEMAALKLQLKKLQDVKDKKKPTKVLTASAQEEDPDTPVTTNQLAAAIKMVMQPQTTPAQQPPPQPPQPNQPDQQQQPVNTPVVIYAGRAGPSGRGRGGRGGGRGRGYNNNSAAYQPNQCFNCGGLGHWARDCLLKQPGLPQSMYLQNMPQQPMMQQQQRIPPMQQPQMMSGQPIGQNYGPPLPPPQPQPRRMMPLHYNSSSQHPGGCFTNYGD